jgi:hypothetical protein
MGGGNGFEPLGPSMNPPQFLAPRPRSSKLIYV